MIFKEELCGYCGACVTVCPLNLLELDEYKINIKKGCNNCKRCQIVCPLGAISGEVPDEV